MVASQRRGDLNFTMTLVVIMVIWLQGADSEKYFFKKEKGFRIAAGTLLRSVYRINMTSSMCASYCVPNCWTAEYSEIEKRCMTYKEHIYNKSIVVIEDSDWNVLRKVVKETVTIGDWTMVFRAQRGIGVSVYDTWSSSGTHNDRPVGNNINRECLGVKYDANCTTHFRSFFLDEWTETKIAQVKFVIYKNDSVVQHIIFNGSDTTTSSWFSTDRILSSSWNVTILRKMEWFTIEGFAKNGKYHRRFYIVRAHKACTTDDSFTMIIDESNEPCSDWKVTVDSPPVILFSPTTGFGNLASQEYDYADVMAVFIKLDIF